jgi:hypothetical protein
MSMLRAIALASLAAPMQQAPPPASAPAPEVTAYSGSLAQGLAEIEALAQKDKTDDALHVADELLAPNSFLRWKAHASEQGGWRQALVAAADPLLDRFGWNGAEPAQRAAVHYARGVVLSRAGRRAESESAFETARSLAGPGDLRLDAIYNLGTSRFMEGEAQRAQIPEISGKPATAPTPAAPGAPGAPGSPGAAPAAPQAPDPLDLARAAYLGASDHFSERLQSDWRDADTRANIELVAKRLKELDAIQKKREEEKQKQEQQKKQDAKDKDKQSKDDKSNDSKDKDQKKQDAKDKPDQDKEQPDEKKNDAQDQKKPDEKKLDDKQQPQDQKNAENDKDKSEQDAQAGDEKEQKLTKEEVIRLFDRLNQIEEKARQMQAQIRRARNAKVKKDW